MRWRRLILLLLVLILAALPGLPWVLNQAVRQGLDAAGLSGSWKGVSGYLLFGGQLRGVKLEGAGIKLEAERLRVSYRLWGLLKNELPVRIRVEQGLVGLEWDKLIPEQPVPPAPGTGGIQLRVEELALEGLEVSVGAGRRLQLPTTALKFSGKGTSYGVQAVLPTGSIRGTVERTGAQFEAWRITAKAEARVLRYWWDGMEAGTIEGLWEVGPKGTVGHNQLKDGVATIAGFRIEKIAGPIEFDQDVVTASLTGNALGGPVASTGQVDLRKQHYQFKVEGTPTLLGIAKRFNLNLPLEGGGPMTLTGSGWEKLLLVGNYNGSGKLVAEPLTYSGTLRFDQVFTLNAGVKGRFFDRTYQASAALKGQDFQVLANDNLGSLITMNGRGQTSRATGSLVWPKPLLGKADLVFAGEGPRWSLQVESPGVGLALAKPFDLSGTLSGAGPKVAGKLGGLEASGTWDDLRFDLRGLEMLVGSTSGRGRLQKGRISAELSYQSPYTSFPFSVRQEGRAWVLSNQFAHGLYQNGAFSLAVAKLPLRFGENMLLSGLANFSKGSWSGDWGLHGTRTDLWGKLAGLATSYQGEVRTPFGSLPVSGVADSRGIRAMAATVKIRSTGGALSARGPLELGALRLQSDLTYQNAEYRGVISFKTPWLEGTLTGRERSLWADAAGYAKLSGSAWPDTNLQGELTLPKLGMVTVPRQPLSIRRDAARLEGGLVKLSANMPFALKLPVKLGESDALLVAGGNLDNARLEMQTRWGTLTATGPFKNAKLGGSLSLPSVGKGEVSGKLDVLSLGYEIGVRLSKLDGGITLKGKGSLLNLNGDFQRGRLKVSGSYRPAKTGTLSGLVAGLEARNFDLTLLGVPASVSGNWGPQGGRLLATGGAGRFEIKGNALLAASFVGSGAWGKASGVLSQEGVDAVAKLALAVLDGEVAVSGQWGGLKASGAGTYKIPYLEPQPWRLTASVSDNRWNLSGPLQLEGQGLSYSGQVNWPYQLLGREGVLKGSVAGEGATLAARLASTYASLPLRLEVNTEGIGTDKIEASLFLPDGSLRLTKGRAVFDLETGPLAKAFGLEVSGRVKGQIGSHGTGQAQAALQAFGEPVSVNYRDRQMDFFLPQESAGLTLQFKEASTEILGKGLVQGRLVVSEKLDGALSYRKDQISFSSRFGGSPQTPSAQIEFVSPKASAVFSILSDIETKSSRGGLDLKSPLLDADLKFTSNGSSYAASGRLTPKAVLRAAGQLVIQGKGSEWQASWKTPELVLGLRARGLSPDEITWNGKALVYAAGRELEVAGKLDYLPSRATGALDIAGGQIGLRLAGEGSKFSLRGGVYGVQAAVESSLDGQLAGGLGYLKSFGQSRLQARAEVSGSLRAPKLQGTGALLGKGRQVDLRFGYDQAPWLEAKGPGVDVSYRDAYAKVNIETGLEAFTGFPATLKIAGQGPFGTLVLPASLEGLGLSLAGKLLPSKLEANLAGSYQKQKISLDYQKELRIQFDGPYVTGLAKVPAEGPSGVLSLDLPFAQGGLKGSLNLAAGAAKLDGYGGVKGAVSVALSEGWKNPTKLSVEADLKTASPYGLSEAPARVEGQLALDLSARSIQGEALATLPEWGGVKLKGQGGRVLVAGTGGFEPLAATLETSPFKASWSYQGALPRGFGRLDARGTWPTAKDKVWLLGSYQVAGQQLAVQGKEDQLWLQGKGISALLTSKSIQVKLSQFPLSGALFSGEIAGPWEALKFALDWTGYGRKGKVEGGYPNGALEASFSGDVSGQITRKQEWAGKLAFKEGSLLVSGRQAVPDLSAEIAGLSARLQYPDLKIASAKNKDQLLLVDLSQRAAKGSLSVLGLEVSGEGKTLLASYALDGGRVEASLDLETLGLEATVPDIGSGRLYYRSGQLSGELHMSVFGSEIALEGAGDRIKVAASYAKSDWLPWEQGSLAGEVLLTGWWQARYQSKAGDQTMALSGKALEVSLEAKGKWLAGNLGYKQASGWQGNLKGDFQLAPLRSKLIFGLQADGKVEASGEVSGAVGQLKFRVQTGAKGLEASADLDNVLFRELPFVGPKVQYLNGRASGKVSYQEGVAELALKASGLGVAGDEKTMPGSLQARWTRSGFSASVGIGPSQAKLVLSGGVLDGTIQASGFPLHWLFSAWAGPLAGHANWTGRASFRYHISNPWASRATLVGETLRFEGGGDTLVGQAALRFENERFYLDQLALSGKGSWKGSGYWGRKGSDLKLDLENTSFTPVLQVIPSLKAYQPEGSGTLKLLATGDVFSLEAQDFQFKLGPVRAQTKSARIRVADTTTAEGKLALTAPFKAEAQLSGAGKLGNFVVLGKGSISLPLLGADEPFEVSLGYPGYVLSASTSKAKFYGTVVPLAGSLWGELPVSYPRYFLQEGMVLANLAVQDDKGRYKIRGSIDILEARLALPEGQKEVVVSAPSTSGPVPVEFENILIRAERNIIIQEALAKGELVGEVYLDGPFSNPYLSGEVRPLSGSFTLWNRLFTVLPEREGETSHARFNPAGGILPDILIIAGTTVPSAKGVYQVDLLLRVKYIREKGKIRPYLDPVFRAKDPVDGHVLNDLEIYALLTLGSTDLQALPENLAQSALQAAVQNFIVGQFERELAKALGLDRVRFDITEALQTGKPEKAGLSFGLYVTPELFVSATLDFSGNRYLSAEYQLDSFRLRLGSNLDPTRPKTDFSFGYRISDLYFGLPPWDLQFNLHNEPEYMRFGFGFRIQL